MFAGKSEELVRRVRRCVYAEQKTVIFSRDTRHGEGNLQTHAGSQCNVEYAGEAMEILTRDLSDVEVVGIDEGQFFGDSLAFVCAQLSDDNIRVIVAGLDMDSECKPFENMGVLMGIAEYVSKISAVCVEPGCHDPATRSYRTAASEERVLEGAGDSYIPLCRHCYNRRKIADA